MFGPSNSCFIFVICAGRVVQVRAIRVRMVVFAASAKFLPPSTTTTDLPTISLLPPYNFALTGGRVTGPRPGEC